MSGQLFNATGAQNRDCPVCYRVGTLTGDRADGSTLECTGGMAPGRSGDMSKGGCCARFIYRQQSKTAGPTLERVASYQDLWNAGARQADDRIPQPTTEGDLDTFGRPLRAGT